MTAFDKSNHIEQTVSLVYEFHRKKYIIVVGFLELDTNTTEE